ncbi:MAG: cbb3-type cytochrome c oxidase subunit 3 [Bacteroidia bacterium]
MYKEILRSMDDAGIFAIIAIIIFMVFFTGLFIYVFTMKKNHVKELAALPLEDDRDDVLHL